MRSSATAFPRASGVVHRVAGDVAELVAQREKDGVMQRGGTTSCLGVPVAFAVRALACACASGHVWASCFLASVVHRCVEGRVWHDQESVRKRFDKVVHTGVGQRERWHGEVHAMPRHG